MTLITQEWILERLKVLLRCSRQVDIAVAWASQGQALSEILKFAGSKPLRAIVGISGNATHPTALTRLAECCSLRIPTPTNSPLFHPKLFLFHLKEGKKIGWIGSANLTFRGFEQNTELCFEFEDDGEALSWFDDLWIKMGDAEVASIVKKYASNWVPPTPPTRSSSLDPAPPPEKEFKKIAQKISDWRSFVEALRAANNFWHEKWGVTVDGETGSWLNTITLGHSLVLREDWSDLTHEEYHLLMGVDYGDGYGLLGSMKGAGHAKKIFNRRTKHSLEIRKKIRRSLTPVILADPTSFPGCASDFIGTLNTIEGFSGAIATRFLTLARPDLAVSVNRGSAQGLATYSGLPQSSLNKAQGAGRSKSYVDLLDFLAKQAWYARPEPKDSFERSLANARGALLDCLVYDPK